MPYSFVDGVFNVEISPNLVDLNGIGLMPMLNNIPKLSKSETIIRWNADLGGQGAVGEPVTATATTDTTPGMVRPASLPIGINRLRTTFSVLTTKEAEARSAGEGELASLIAKAASNSIKIITRTVAGAIYGGDGTAASGGIIGLNGIVTPVLNSKSTSAYAGIDPTVAGNEHWTNYVNTAGVNRALTPALLYKMSEEIVGGLTLGTNQNFDSIYMNPVLCTRYKELFDQVAGVAPVDGGNVAELGYTGLAFEGRPIWMDPYAPANKVFFVDSSAVGLYSFVENEAAFGDEEPTDGIVFKIVELARTNPDAVQFGCVAKNQLVAFNRAGINVLDAIVQ